MAKDDTRLIVEVEKNKVLYDPKNKYYKDISSKEKAWEEIASAISADVKSSVLYFSICKSVLFEGSLLKKFCRYMKTHQH